MPCRSIFSGCRQESSQKLYSTGWTDGQKISTGALDVPCSREHVLVDFNFSSAPVEPMPLWSMHRCNDASVDTVSELQRLLIGHRETGWTDAYTFYPVGSSGGHGFSAVDFQRLCNSFHSIKGHPLAHFSCLWHLEYLRPPLIRREKALRKREKI